MTGRRYFSSAIALLIAFVSLLAGGVRASAAPDADAYAKCAAACRACETACAACNKHCEAMVKAGDKTHAKSVQLSADCRDICELAAKICARKGPMASSICQACIKACNACGNECGKSPKMAPMAACKKACDACAAACKTMV